VEAEGGEAEAAGAMMTGDMAAEDTMTGEEAEAGAMMTEEEAADITTTEGATGMTGGAAAAVAATEATGEERRVTATSG